MSERTNQQRAVEIMATLAGVAVEHITAAPEFCSDGYDGACDREGCWIVAGVPLIKQVLDEAEDRGVRVKPKVPLMVTCQECGATRVINRAS